MHVENKKKRLYVVDALRGFAIMAIMLLHNLEHFDYYFLPPNLSDWMIRLDKITWDSLFFLFAGKAYGIFALLFGLTFFIQTNNQEQKGHDFRPRFVWRLVLLFGFGMINSAFFQGDILTLYAAVGLLLIPMYKLNDKMVFLIALLLFLQPLEMFHLFEAMQHPDVKLSNPESWTYFGKMGSYIEGDSFINTVKGNLTNGKKAVFLWNWENGRFFHMLSLFMLGMLAGRKQLFVANEKHRKIWIKFLMIASISFIFLYLIQIYFTPNITSEAVRRSFSTIETSWTNMAFMVVLVSGFVLLFHMKYFNKALNIFAPIGSMSLSNYIFQSIIGASLYYGFGLGLYKYTGATYSLLIGIVLAVTMGWMSIWWAKRYKRGPLETIWHKLTWISSKDLKKNSKVIKKQVSMQ